VRVSAWSVVLVLVLVRGQLSFQNGKEFQVRSSVALHTPTQLRNGEPNGMDGGMAGWLAGWMDG
jgi:hypothetical protein